MSTIQTFTLIIPFYLQNTKIHFNTPLSLCPFHPHIEWSASRCLLHHLFAEPKAMKKLTGSGFKRGRVHLVKFITNDLGRHDVNVTLAMWWTVMKNGSKLHGAPPASSPHFFLDPLPTAWLIAPNMKQSSWRRAIAAIERPSSNRLCSSATTFTTACTAVVSSGLASLSRNQMSLDSMVRARHVWHLETEWCLHVILMFLVLRKCGRCNCSSQKVAVTDYVHRKVLQ